VRSTRSQTTTRFGKPNHCLEKPSRLAPRKGLVTRQDGRQKHAAGRKFLHPPHSAKANLPGAKGEKAQENSGKGPSHRILQA